MKVTIAATQMACSWDMEENLGTAERLVRAAAKQGANVILLQEMFATHFFAFMDWKAEFFKFALPIKGNPILARMASWQKNWVSCCPSISSSAPIMLITTLL